MTTVTTQHGGDAGVIDLARGDPDPSLLPLALVRQAAERVTAAGDSGVLQYGFEPGDVGFREQLGAMLGRQGGAVVTPEALFVTPGASLALDLISTLLAPAGARVLVANPTYHLALALFADHGLQVEAVAGDEHGIDPDALEAALRRGPAAFVYLVPVHGNPTGATLPRERAVALVSLARRYGVRIVADEVYRLTRFDVARGVAPSLADLGPDVVLALGSFSKVLSPGLRLGWVQGPAPDLERVAGSGVLRSGGGMNPFTAALVRELLSDGSFESHLEALRRRLARRHAALAGALALHLPEATAPAVDGGYFLWLQLPGVDTRGAAFSEALERAGVRAAPGERFVPPGAELGPAGSSLRVCFAHVALADLAHAAERLAGCVRELAGPRR